MSIKRTGGRKPTMGNWRASIWPRANMQYVNVVISMGICIWMHARYTGASLPGDTRVLATCALGLTPVRHPRCSTYFHSFLRPPSFDSRLNIVRARRCTASARGFANAFFIYAERPNALSPCLHAVSELIEGMNGDIKIKKENILLEEYLLPQTLLTRLFKNIIELL